MPPNLYNKFLESLWNKLSKDVGTTLVNLGAVGWFLSAAAQITMIAQNKNIDKKEKKFLIPQETADGVINVGLYYTICAGIKKWGDSLVEKGRFMTERTRNFLLSFKNPSVSMQEYIKGMEESYVYERIINPKEVKGRLTRFLRGTIVNLESMDPKTPSELSATYENTLKDSLKRSNPKATVDRVIADIKFVLNDFNEFKNVFGIISAIGASIIACNLITPIARNMTANYFQKKSLEKIKRKTPVEKTEIKPVVYQLPSSTVFNTFKF